MSIKITMEFATIEAAVDSLAAIACPTISAPESTIDLPEKKEKPAKDKKTTKKSPKNKKASTHAPLLLVEDPNGGSIDDVRTSLSACLDAAGREVTVQILKDHSAEKLTDLDPSEYGSFVKACDAAVAEITGN